MAFQAGQRLTASALNAAVGATWTDYTPAWTASGSNPAIGNGVLVGAWTKVGKTVSVRISMLAGSTTTFGSGGWLFSLPQAAATVLSLGVNAPWVGTVYGFDAGTATRDGVCDVKSGASDLSITSNGGGDTWRSTIPQTWANGDYLVAELSYEAATF